mmetsp:Transcript_33204/g.76635  ORF Transcript_33204/g.76635 Transcript_33204/m.76635 type:complete len:187 (-) Transcript_33204:16-576(-)
MGLFDAKPTESDYSFLVNRKENWEIFKGSEKMSVSEFEHLNIPVIKTHEKEIDILSSIFEPAYGKNIFFLRSDRCHHDPHCELESLLCIKYEEMIYQNLDEKKKVIDRIVSIISEGFPYFKLKGIKMDAEAALNRLNDMDASISSLSRPDNTTKIYFKQAINPKYGIHGNHREQVWRRNKKNKKYC